MDKTTHQIRSEQWTQIINDWAQSGMNKTAWCKANGISDKSFFYWQRILRNESYIEATGSAVPAVIPESTEKISFVEIKAEDLPSQKKSDFIPDVPLCKACEELKEVAEIIVSTDMRNLESYQKAVNILASL